jgi:Uncharacterized conserved protein
MSDVGKPLDVQRVARATRRDHFTSAMKAAAKSAMTPSVFASRRSGPNHRRTRLVTGRKTGSTSLPGPISAARLSHLGETGTLWPGPPCFSAHLFRRMIPSAPRMDWKGTFKVGAVACAVALCTASTFERIAFQTIDRAAAHPVRRVTRTWTDDACQPRGPDRSGPRAVRRLSGHTMTKSVWCTAGWSTRRANSTAMASPVPSGS